MKPQDYVGLYILVTMITLGAVNYLYRTVHAKHKYTRHKVSSHEAPIGNLTLPRVLRTP